MSKLFEFVFLTFLASAILCMCTDSKETNDPFKGRSMVKREITCPFDYLECPNVQRYMREHQNSRTDTVTDPKGNP